jgi:hypothetical protein
MCGRSGSRPRPGDPDHLIVRLDERTTLDVVEQEDDAGEGDRDFRSRH